MKCASSVLASILTFAVSLASVSCACADVLPTKADETVAHVRHHDHGAPATTDCADSGCGGNGGFDAVLPERPAGLAEAVEITAEPEHGMVPTAPEFAVVENSFAIPEPLPPDRRHIPGTPVTRFDIRLN